MNEEVTGGDNAAVEAPKNDFVDPDAIQEEQKPEEKVDDTSESSESAEPKSAEVAEEGEADETEASSETDQDLVVKKPKKGGFQKKIGRLETKVAELEAQLAKKTASEAPPTDTAPPVLDDFDTWEDYDQARITHATKMAIKEQNEAQFKSNQEKEWKASFQTKVDRFEEQKEALSEAHDDFDEVVTDNDFEVPPIMATAILESEISGEVAYYLGKNPDEAEKMAKMGIVAANKFVGKIEAKIEASKTEKKEVKVKKTTDAPPPVTPVKAATKSDSIDFDNCSHEEYQAWRKKREA